MTEAQAHNFLSWCGRKWIGRKTISEEETIPKMKESCFLLMLASCVPIVLGLIDYLNNKNAWDFVHKIVLIFGLVIFCLATWLLVRLRQSCKALERKF